MTKTFWAPAAYGINYQAATATSLGQTLQSSA
jgi:hypothetical protein